MKTTHTNINPRKSLRLLLKYLRGLFFTVARSLSLLRQSKQLVHSLGPSPDMDDVRLGMISLLREDDYDDSSTRAVKIVLLKAWNNGEIPLLLDLSAEGIVRYYRDNIITKYPEGVLMHEILKDYETMAVFLRGVRVIKNEYMINGWIAPPKSFLA